MANSDREPRNWDWADELVRRVGLTAKAVRGNRSAKWLSDRTGELGFRISPTVIAKLDSGHRGSVLGVSELLIIAAALDVPPLALLYPDLPDGRIEFLPGQDESSINAVKEFSGRGKSQQTILGKLLLHTHERIGTEQTLQSWEPMLAVTADSPSGTPDEQEMRQNVMREAAVGEIQRLREHIDRLNEIMGNLPGSKVKTKGDH